TALVISPLIALMKDQIDQLTRRGIAATFINSSLNTTEQSRRLRTLAEGQYKIVLVAPERLRSRAFREALARIPLSLLAVDEAHCLSQWGHDFRPDYLHIAEARADFKAPVTLALTATATPRVQDDIIRMLGLSHAERIITGFNRPSLTFEVFSTPDVKAKLNFVRDFLASVEGAGIIYTGTRRDAEEVAEFIREVAGIETRHYHGALDPDVRAEVQDAFMAGDLPIAVATNAFGMGIDRPDVRFVLHYDMPGTLEAYYQEAGRAGRDGLPARVILLYSPKDTALQEFFIENDSPSAGDLRAVHSFLRRSPETRLDEIERATGLPQIKARVALDQLEAAHALRRFPDGAFGLIRVETLPLAESDVQAVVAQVAARREHKYRQLEIMVDYAETNACRRRAILNHFGDTGSADAPLCCDNCLSRAEVVEAESRSAQTQSERAALIVLDTAAHLKWEVGKSKLAQILKGSTAKDMTRFNYDKVRNYGKFITLRLSEIESLIGQLIDTGYLKQVGSKLPTLKLTPKGESALKAHTAIRVDLRPVQPGAAQKVRAEREAGGTVALTGQMLARGLSPEQIAAERGLTVSTIYSHLAQLIAEDRVSIDAVVSADLQKQIRAAIEAVGSVDYLAPI
ncbi:MAG: RecQ family ATP-dependent DNA helicase, partial [Thermodesulfobacteriota bacterium]